MTVHKNTTNTPRAWHVDKQTRQEENPRVTFSELSAWGVPASASAKNREKRSVSRREMALHQSGSASDDVQDAQTWGIDPALLDPFADGGTGEAGGEAGAPRLIVSPVACLIVILILTVALAASLVMLVMQGRALTRVAEGTLDVGGISLPESTVVTPAPVPTVTVVQSVAPSVSPAVSPSVEVGSQADAGGGMSGVDDSGLVNINTATSEQLQTVTGIGPVTAQKIVDYRAAHGPYARVDDLLNVSGIGVKTLARIRVGLTV